MKVSAIIIFLILFVGCKSSIPNYHNGTYVSTNKFMSNAMSEAITINGNRATLRLHSLLNKSKLKQTELLCIQHPDRIELHLRMQPPIIITVEKGNLMWDGELFQKQAPMH